MIGFRHYQERKKLHEIQNSSDRLYLCNDFSFDILGIYKNKLFTRFECSFLGRWWGINGVTQMSQKLSLINYAASFFYFFGEAVSKDLTNFRRDTGNAG